MRIHVVTGAAIAGALIAATATPAAAVPDQLGITARVTDGGAPLTGSHSFAIRIFGVASGGTQVWTETDAATVSNGLVYLTLGDQTALDANVLDGGPLWVELQVDATVLSPRLAVTSAAYAVRAGVAEDAELLGGQPATAFLPKGPTLACTGTDKMTGINGTTGAVTCAPDTDTNTAYTAGPGVALTGNAFSAIFAGSGVTNSVARSDHNHTGVYLPVAAAGRICAGTQKVSALNVDGTVTCTNDVDTDTNTTYTAGPGLGLTGTQFNVNFLGSGTATAAAHSDHNHAGVYLPVAAAGRACTGTQKVSTLNVDGTVTCTNDTDTTYAAGAGLALAGTTFSASYAGSGGSFGTASTLARSDHHHAPSCPPGYTPYVIPNANAYECVRVVAGTTSWYNAARTCGTAGGGHLCTFQDILTVRQIDLNFTLGTSTWLGDRTGDDSALQVNNTIFTGSTDNFDGEVNITNTNGTAAACCLQRDWP